MRPRRPYGRVVFFQAEDGIRDIGVTGVQTCALPISYGDVYYTTYPNKLEQQIGFAMIQMLWDRGEANGYAHHMTSDPLAGTPAHEVLLHVAYGDHQVANVAAEVEARTIGAATNVGFLAPGRHWSVDPTFGMPTFSGSW